MTVSIRRMSLGEGYAYLMRSVARGDVERAAGTPLTRYYAESGTPPGRWLGAGVAGLGDGAGLATGSTVTHEQLFRLLGMLQDPLTGQQLGRMPQVSSGSAAVAGFDLTFSVPKSVSAVWALADPSTQAAIHQAHRDAVDIALGWAERNVIFTRTGVAGAVQEDVRGVVAAAFDHWDSRAGDPHLHTHVVIANRVQSVADGRWRSLDGRTLYRYVVALSELHEGVLTDLLGVRLGFAWEERVRRHSAVPRLEVAGVPASMVQEFSRRSADIEAAMPALIQSFADAHGHQPSAVQLLKLRQQATLETRPAKDGQTLADQLAAWRVRAAPHLTGEPEQWAAQLRDRGVLPPLHAETAPDQTLQEIARLALDTVAARRATFGHANVLAEVHRYLHGAQFATPADRIAVAEHATRTALEQAVRLTPQVPAVRPELVRADGTSKLAHRGAELFTSRAILDAEARLLAAGRDTSGPTALVADEHTAGLSADQGAAVTAIAHSGRALDLLVGPAGAGKTTALAALRAAWEANHGRGSVVGLAPSAAAAAVLAAGLGVATDNTAKWLVEQQRNPDRRAVIDRVAQQLVQASQHSFAKREQLRNELHRLRAEQGRWTMRAGQLVVIDEASLAGTLALDAIITQAEAAGAKVLLVGDWAQLGAIEAGGAFAMLANDRPDTPELDQVHRFTEDWEREASVQLRTGNPAAIEAYQAHGRIHSGDRDQMLAELLDAWRRDTQAGHSTLMIATDRATVADLNQAAQSLRSAAGEVTRPATPISGAAAGVGDVIVTRHNDRTLATAGGWVRNGDIWTVTATGRNGSIRAQRSSDDAEVTLPVDYVRAHVELGYATTTLRVQGRTVDTAHALITERDSRELLYVAATRARVTNTLYVDTTSEPDADTSHGPAGGPPAGTVLEAVLARSHAETAAHDAQRREAARVHAIDEPIDAVEIPLRWTRLDQDRSRTHEPGHRIEL